MKGKSRMAAGTIDEYLRSLVPDKRSALQKLRKAIRAAAPDAEECISYGLPAFRLDGRVLVCFGAAANHCSFFPGSGTTVAAHARLLKGYDTSKGTIRFTPDRPLPAALVRRLVRARIAENVSREQPVRSARSPGKPRREAGTVRRAKPSTTERNASKQPSDPAVAEFLRKLAHPLKPEIEAVRRIILGVSPKIREGIKWNSPSFRTDDSDYFATLNLRARDGEERVWLILHTGAKAKGRKQELKIADPDGLLQWLDKNRCLVTFRDKRDVQAKRSALQAIVREWIAAY